MRTGLDSRIGSARAAWTGLGGVSRRGKAGPGMAGHVGRERAGLVRVGMSSRTAGAGSGWLVGQERRVGRAWPGVGRFGLSAWFGWFWTGMASRHGGDWIDLASRHGVVRVALRWYVGVARGRGGTEWSVGQGTGWDGTASRFGTAWDGQYRLVVAALTRRCLYFTVTNDVSWCCAYSSHRGHQSPVRSGGGVRRAVSVAA